QTREQRRGKRTIADPRHQMHRRTFRRRSDYCVSSIPITHVKKLIILARRATAQPAKVARYLIGTDTSVKASMLAPSWSNRGVAKPVTVSYVEPSPVETDTRSADGPLRWPSAPMASCSGSTRLASSALGSGSVTAMAPPATAVEGIHTYQFKVAWLESL